MKRLLSVIIVVTLTFINVYAQEIKERVQKVSMRGYNIEIPETWTATDNFDPAISDFRFIASYSTNDALEIIPLPSNQSIWSPEKILNSRSFFTDKQLVITSVHKSRRYKPYEQVFAIQSNYNDKTIAGEIIIIENGGYKYVLMYYGNKRFCKSEELKHAIQSFTPVLVKDIDPDAGITDSIKAQIPQEIDIDNYAKTTDGWYIYDNWGVQFEFSNEWTVLSDQAKDGIQDFSANSNNGNEFITIIISSDTIVSPKMIETKIEQRKSLSETYFDKQTSQIDSLSAFDYPFLIKNEENADLPPMYGEIKIFGDSLRQFYIVSISADTIATNPHFNRLFKSFKIDRNWQPEEDYFIKKRNLDKILKADQDTEEE